MGDSTPGREAMGGKKETIILNQRKTIGFASKIRDLPLTEKENPSFRNLDRLSSLEIARLINKEDQKVTRAVRTQLKPISRAIDLLRDSLSIGGRLFYVGAGTSGRLGVLDAAECPPTFGVSPAMIQGIIAGGKRALWKAVEGAEDDREGGAEAVRKAKVCFPDIVCGISASGKTPFVQGALAEARKKGAQTILITCHPNPALRNYAQVLIKAVVGPEVIAGSTRMKAGTATKMILNMISSATMIQMGRVWRNLMVDVQPTSRKLKQRALRIIRQVLGCSAAEAKKLFTAAHGQTKVAIVMGGRNLERKEAKQWIAQRKGSLRGIRFRR